MQWKRLPECEAIWEPAEALWQFEEKIHSFHEEDAIITLGKERMSQTDKFRCCPSLKDSGRNLKILDVKLEFPKTM
ncbi:unnamed protein product [Camellia sinensis]